MKSLWPLLKRANVMDWTVIVVAIVMLGTAIAIHFYDEIHDPRHLIMQDK